MNEIVLVELDPDRWADFRSLRLDAIRTDPGAFGARLADNEARPPEYWQDRLRDARLRRTAWLTFAEQAGILVGMVGAFVLDDSQEAMLVSMWVCPEVRRQGVGHRLIEALIKSIRSTRPDLTGLRLMVHTTQPAAMRLYESSGFQIIQEDGIELTMFLSL